MRVDLRSEQRKSADCTVELTWKTEAGEKRFENCSALNLSEIGVAIECPESIPLLAHVIVRAPAFEVVALARVKHCTWVRAIYVLGLQFVARSSTGAGDPMAPDHYEILRLSPRSDNDTIERVYRTLAKRFHPDNESTGDAEIFLRIAEAHRILMDPGQREIYDTERRGAKSLVRFDLRSREFFAGLQGERNRRLAALCLLYRKRTSDHESPGLSLLDLESLSAFTREELGFALWYLCEKKLVTIDDRSHYGITTGGVDYVETTLTHNCTEPEHTGLRAIAALQMPGPSSAADGHCADPAISSVS
jgi:curved DNA-binding protein